MSMSVVSATSARPRHPWLRQISLTHVPGPSDPVLDGVTQKLLACFRRLGHEVQAQPDEGTDVIVTTARFGEPISWREAPLFAARRRFGLSHLPAPYTLVHVSPREFERLMAR